MKMHYYKLFTSIIILFISNTVSAKFELKAPSNLELKVGSPSHLSLSWKDNSDVEEGFIIETKQKGEQFWVKGGSVPENITQFQVAGLATNTTYEFRVRAFKGEVYSDYCEIKSAKTVNKLSDQQSVTIENTMPRQGEATALKMMNGDYHLYFGSFTGTGDKSISQIARKVSTDKGMTWSKMEVLFQEEGTSLLHPSVIRYSDGKIGLVYSKMVGGSWQAWKVSRYSTDEGTTWSEEIKVTDGIYDYMTGAHDRFVTLSNGIVVNILHGVVKIHQDYKSKSLGTDLYATKDHGLTWFRLNEETIMSYENPFRLGEYGFYESSMVEYEPGRLAIFGRSATGFLMGAYSEDMGKTWSLPVKLGIQHPLAPVRVQMLPDSNTILLVHNPRKDYNTGATLDRFVLASRVSKDGGRTWNNYKQLEYDGINHYSYPAIFIDNDMVHLFHWKTNLENNRWKKVEIAHRMLPVSELVD